MEKIGEIYIALVGVEQRIVIFIIIIRPRLIEMIRS